jgi:ParB-like chromosome segregation protein Spo0J
MTAFNTSTSAAAWRDLVHGRSNRMKFYTRDWYESRGVAERLSRLLIARIAIGDRLYPGDEENVARLTEAYRRGDALPPIRVRHLPDFSRPMAEWTFPLIYGHCRLLAAKAAGHTEIDVEIVGCTDAEARRMKARENLDRRTLSADQRMHGTAAILQSRLREEQSVPSGPKGHRGESGLSKAARDEGISETTAKRAMRIEAVTAAAKALYRAELPDIARIDLEEIAAAPPERQVEVTRRIINDRKTGRPRRMAVPKTRKSPSKTSPADNSSAKPRADQSEYITIAADSGAPQPRHQGGTHDVASRAEVFSNGGAPQRDGSPTALQAAGNETKSPPPPRGVTDEGNEDDDQRQDDRSKTERDFDRLQKAWQCAGLAAREHFAAWLDGQGVLEPLMKQARADHDEASKCSAGGSDGCIGATA